MLNHAQKNGLDNPENGKDLKLGWHESMNDQRAAEQQRKKSDCVFTTVVVSVVATQNGSKHEADKGAACEDCIHPTAMADQVQIGDDRLPLAVSKRGEGRVVAAVIDELLTRRAN